MLVSGKKFFQSVGFDIDSYDTIEECKKAMRNVWLVYDKFGKVKCLKTCGTDEAENGTECDFKYVSGEDTDNLQIMSNWLRENQLYASALDIFLDREAEFYRMNLLDKLKYFGWDVENGQLVKTAW